MTGKPKTRIAETGIPSRGPINKCHFHRSYAVKRKISTAIFIGMLCIVTSCTSQRRNRSVDIEKVKEKIQTCRKQSVPYLKQTVRRDRVEDLLKTIKSKMFAVGGDIKSFTKGVVKSKTAFYHRLFVTADVRMSFDNLIKFLKWCEEHDQRIFMKTIDIVPEKNVKHLIKMQFYLYVRYHSERFFIEKLMIEASIGNRDNLKEEDYLPILRDFYQSRLIVSKRLFAVEWQWSARIDSLATLPRSLTVVGLKIKDADYDPKITIIMKSQGRDNSREAILEFFRKNQVFGKGLLPPDVTTEEKGTLRVVFAAS